MFCGEMARPGGGAMCTGEHRTLGEAQESIEEAARHFAAIAAAAPAKAVRQAPVLRTVIAAPQHAHPAPAPRIAARPAMSDREMFMRMTGAA
jgi:hypothetical protein